MKKLLIGLTIPLVIGVLWGCDVKQTEEGKLPDVDVDVDAGKLPKFEVETADVDVGTKKVEVEVPNVDVNMEKKEITVPTVDVEMPGEEDGEESAEEKSN